MSCLGFLVDSTHPPNPTALFRSDGSSSVPDLMVSAVGPGEIAIQSSYLRDLPRTRLEGPGGKTGRTSTPTSQPASTNPQMPVSDWKATAKEGLGVASRFTQTLLKRVPECVDVNPVKVAFAIAKVIIDIKDVSGRLCISCAG
jgi:hypothetical protein